MAVERGNMKKYLLIGLGFGAAIILLGTSFLEGSSAPRSRFCKLGINERLASAAAIYEVRIENVTPYDTSTDSSTPIEPCTYTVSVVDTIYRDSHAQSSPPIFEILNVFPGQEQRPTCMKPQDIFLAVVEESAFKQGEFLECDSASITDISQKEYILKYLFKKGS